ncbi:MAG: CRISPR-associated helicase Cas3' [Cyanobacteria bacterium J06626_23]
MPPKLVPNLLLAKSVEGAWRGSYTLVGHTADVVNRVTKLVDVLGERLLTQFRLSCSLEALKATARLAAYIHDWGKANDHFQGVVRHRMSGALPKRNPKVTPQLLRHEALSVLLAWEFKDWLSQGKGDFMLALAAAGGHHLKLGGRAGECTDNVGELRQCGDDRLALYAMTPAFIALLKYGRRALGLPSLQISSSKAASLNLWKVTDIKVRQRTVQDAFENWQADVPLLAVLKALLICGDSIGSAALTVNVPIDRWICEESNRTLTPEKSQQIVDARLDGNELRPFQEALAASQTRVTLARAGCGTGKTLGAYAWAKRHANGRKLFFCYPTTGTSTEGFIDYVHGQADAALLHSRAGVDLARWEEEQRKKEIQSIYSTGEEEDTGDSSDNEIAKKLESFKAWGREVNVCTVDTVLGLLQCNRRSLYCFPAIATAAFVFDEVHCYDEKLLGALLRFLELVNAPVLLMSASFLPWQRELIEQAAGETVEMVEGPKDIETQPRYRFHYQDQPDWDRVEAELNAGGKVLWVCNRVNEAIEVYRQARDKGLNAVVYHSRFRYWDRVDHHRAVVDGFKEGGPPILAIATQVAEMSLDLSASLLVTQIADPAGLIQRLGRLNRRYCGHALDAFFYPDGKPGYPYPQEDLDNGLAVVQRFAGDVSQAQLAACLEGVDNRASPDRESVLLDEGWRTYPASLRQAGHNVTAILEADLETVKGLPNKELPKYTVPLPNQKLKQWDVGRHKFYPVAASEWWGYSKEEGAFEKGRR